MCWAPVKGWGPTCLWCGTGVRDQGTATPGRPSAPRAPQVAATLADALAEERRVVGPPAAKGPGAAANDPGAGTAGASPDTAGSAAGAGPGTITSVSAAMAGEPASTDRAPYEPTALERVGARRGDHLAPVDASPVVNLSIAGPQVLCSAIFVTGSVGLRAGSWYTIELDGSDLAIRGPLEVDPRAAVLVRPVGEIDSYAFNGQLIVHGERGLVLVFMRVSGDTADHLAEVIADAARGAGEAAS